jgi:hypothetical protein
MRPWWCSRQRPAEHSEWASVPAWRRSPAGSREFAERRNVDRTLSLRECRLDSDSRDDPRAERYRKQRAVSKEEGEFARGRGMKSTPAWWCESEAKFNSDTLSSRPTALARAEGSAVCPPRNSSCEKHVVAALKMTKQNRPCPYFVEKQN